MRHRRDRLAAGLATCVAGLVVLTAGLSWACTPQAQITVVPSVGLAQSRVLVTGKDWRSGVTAAPVAIRWNSPAGPLMGEAQPTSTEGDNAATGEGGGGSFSIEVTIPDVPAGVYYIVATQAPPKLSSGHPTNNVGNGMQRAPFEVISAGYGSGSPASQTSGDPATQTGQASQAESRSTSEGGSVGATSGADANTSSSGRPSTVVVPPRGASTAPAVPAQQPADVKRPVIPKVAPAASAPAPAPAQPALIEGAVPPEPSSVETAAGSSSRTVHGDVWSGFAYGLSKQRRFGGSDLNSGASGGASLSVGVGILSAGLIALAAGLGVLEVRRRREALGAFGRSGGTGRS